MIHYYIRLCNIASICDLGIKTISHVNSQLVLIYSNYHKKFIFKHPWILEHLYIKWCFCEYTTMQLMIPRLSGPWPFKKSFFPAFPSMILVVGIVTSLFAESCWALIWIITVRTFTTVSPRIPYDRPCYDAENAVPHAPRHLYLPQSTCVWGQALYQQVSDQCWWTCVYVTCMGANRQVNDQSW